MKKKKNDYRSMSQSYEIFKLNETKAKRNYDYV